MKFILRGWYQRQQKTLYPYTRELVLVKRISAVANMVRFPVLKVLVMVIP